MKPTVDLTENTNWDRSLDQGILNQLLEHGFDGLLVFDLKKGRTVKANKRMADLLGCPIEEILTSDPFRFIPEFQPDGRKSFDVGKAHAKLTLKNKLHNFSWQQKKANGELFWSEVTAKILDPPFENCAIAIHRDISESVSQKIKTEKEKERNEFLFENAFDGIIIFDINLDRPVECNQKFLDYLGVTRDEFMEQPPENSSPEFQSNGMPSLAYRQQLTEEMENKDFLQIPWTHQRKDGELLRSEMSIYKMPAPQEHLRMCIIKDTTEQTKSNQALQENEVGLLEAQRLAKMASFKYYVYNDKLVWSNMAYTLMEIDTHAPPVSIDHYLKLVHPDDKKDFISVLAFARESNRSFETELRFFTASGNIVHIKFKAEPVLDENGQVFRGTAVDITNQKVVEQNLRETSAKYIDIFNNMYDALLIIGEEGLMSDVNLAGQKLLGYTKSELSKIRIPEIVHPDDVEKSRKYLEKLKKDGFYSDYVGRIIRKDGQVRYLQVNSNAIMKDGKMVGSRDIARDITALKEAELKREQLLSELEAVNKELTDFAYIVSHDLKAPLRAISNLSKWIAEDYESQINARGKELLRLLNQRVDRMHNFIEAILDYSRIGKTDSNMEFFSIKSLLLDVIDSLAPPTNFSINLPDELPHYLASKTRIGQLFQNIISNAIKYNDKNNGVIDITFIETSTHWQFSIRDNGPGIEEKFQEKIFQIFQTLQSRDHYESTGIGLTIVKRIVQANEGKIWVTSNVGSDSCFHFTLIKRSQ